MIATILGWTKLPQWVLELIVILIVALGVFWVLHSRFEAGIAAQKQADSVAAAAQLQEAENRAHTAELSYAKEHQANLDFMRDHPIGDVRLCVTTVAKLPASPSHAGNAKAGAPAADVQTVPGGDSGGGPRAAGPNIGDLLSLLADRADDVSGVLREYQSR
jgi:hypothetical protein